MTRPYVDTSALAKWYQNEEGSPEFEAFAVASSGLLISRLAVVEFHCLLARRRRAREIDAGIEREAIELLDADIRAGHIDVLPMEDAHGVLACRLIGELRNHALRTLDALHLAIAVSAGVQMLATADLRMANAAAAMGLETVRFGLAGRA